ncbi:polysaccharide deacetylase family protein [Oscillibacter sp.]|uniref:polysaccharide deacetylase family protein n=1 Tax=Oscillibacter sp. TaxID=1945593 RepID=UPI0028B1670F|nr:polysaccharide deacetylase family protein [Oscillibacter sp.]
MLPWGNEDTQTLINILEQYNVKTTFFVVGDWVDKYPESVKALSDAGHEIMSHSSHHDHYNSLSTEKITADLKESSDKIEAISGVRPALIRCPYGEYDDHVVKAIRDYGMEPIQWDVDSLDWKGLSADEITRRVTSRVQPGSIVLFHNAAENTPAALPGILEYLIGQGYSVVPISHIIINGAYNQDYTIDHTGRQKASKSVTEGSAAPSGSSGAVNPPASSTGAA